MIKDLFEIPVYVNGECGRACKVGLYLDYKNCKCWKKIIIRLVEECSENIDGNEMIYDYEKVL